jgi:hypothetical protein
MIVAGVLAALLLGGVVVLTALGLRTGDRPGDVLLLDVRAHRAPRGATVTVTNPGAAPVILGMSLRRAGARLRLEGVAYVTIRTGKTDPHLLADRQARIGVLDADETRTFRVPARPDLGRRAELMVIVGQRGRLRIIHRLVVLPEPQSGAGAGRSGRIDTRTPGIRKSVAKRERRRGHQQHGRPRADRQRDDVR